MADTIRTERLVLRPIRASDAEAICRQIGDWEVMRWLSQPPWPYSLEHAEAFIRSRSGITLAETTFAITRADAVMGVVDLRAEPARQPRRAPAPNLGYWLGRSHWGNGYMTEAAGALISHAFAAEIGETIYSGAFADNAASLRVQAKLGFVRDGENMLYALPRGKEFPHVDTMLTRSAFEARRP